jgi:hypothetical protein
MTTTEKQLIDAIKALPGHQVFPGSLGGCVKIARTLPNGISLQSVWLNRPSSINNLQNILAAAKVAA